MKRRILLRAVAALGTGTVAGLQSAVGHAQAFPARQVRMITPFPPGSGPDAALRLISAHLSKAWNEPVVVDNKPGGNGFIAVSTFQQGNPDGHDLIELDNSHITTHPRIFRNLPYQVGRLHAPGYDPAHLVFRRRGSRQPLQDGRRHRCRSEGRPWNRQLRLLVHWKPRPSRRAALTRADRHTDDTYSLSRLWSAVHGRGQQGTRLGVWERSECGRS